MRYAIRPPSQKVEKGFDDLYYEKEIVFYPTVYDGDDYVETGLVDEYGNEILRFVGTLPIGFLADHSEE